MAAARLERHVLRVCAGACLVLLFFTGTPALAQDEPGRGARTTGDQPPVERLWQEYPLNPASTVPSSVELTPSKVPPAASTPAAGYEDDGFQPILLTFAGIAIALLALLALSTLRPAPRPRLARQGSAPYVSPRPRNGASTLAMQSPSPTFSGNRRVDDDGGDTSRAPSKPMAERSTVNEELFVSQSLRARSSPMSKQPEQARPEPGAPDDSKATMDYAHVGEKVTELLTSAQHAADQMLASAREEANRLRSSAQEQAAAERVEAASETERMQRESERLRLEAETHRKQTREAADAYAVTTRAEVEREAERRLAEADERAQAIVAEAEQRARYVAQEEVRRQEALASGAERHEERLKSLLEVFRGMSTQLEDLIGANQEAKDRNQAREEAEQVTGATNGEALEEVLKPDGQTHVRAT